MNNKRKGRKRKIPTKTQDNKECKRRCTRKTSATIDSSESDTDSEPSDSDDSDPTDSIVSSENEDDVSNTSEESESEHEVDTVVDSEDWQPVTGTSLNQFTFTEIVTSPVINVESKPIEIFNLFVTDEVYDLIVTQTNLNARKKLCNPVKRCSRMRKCTWE